MKESQNGKQRTIDGFVCRSELISRVPQIGKERKISSNKASEPE